MDYEEFRQKDGYFYYIYKIINKLDNKFYIGYHKTQNIEDGYMGSGLRIKYAIEKYGIDNFEKQYLYFVLNETELFEKEKELVNEDLIKRDDCYNIALGGKASEWKKAENKRLLLLQDKNSEWYKNYMNKMSDAGKKLWENNEHRLKVSDSIKKSIKNNGHSWLGKKHSEETKSKLRKPKNIGEGNSQFGTCWIHNLDLKQSMKIKKENIDMFIQAGWVKGRKIKF